MYRKFFNLMLALVLALSVSTSALAQGNASPSAQEKAKSYIILLANDPIASYNGELAGYAATEPTGGEKVEPNSAEVRKYENFLKDKHNKSLQEARVSPSAKVHDYTFALNGYSAILTDSQAEAVKAQKDVVLVLEDQMRYPQTDSSPEFLGLTVRGGAYDSGYTGEGVVVGVIDTGIWPEHPSFADDGSYPPLPDYAGLPCEFGNTAWNPNDVPFTCNNKLLGARQVLDTYRYYIGADPDEFDSARDDEGHGTHTASTAAGNAGVEASMYGMPVATISGIAPRARVIAYKALGNQGGFSSDLAAAIDQAVADGVDVINYSIGGGPSVTGADDIAFLFAADAGVFVATSAGNSGPGAGTVGGPGTAPWVTTVGASTQSRFFEGVVTLGNGKKYIGASLTPELGWRRLVDAEDAGDDLCTPAYLGGGLDPSVVKGKIVLCRRGAVNRQDKSLAVYEAGGVGMIMYNNDDVDNLFTDTHWVPSVQIDNTPGLKIKAYIDSARFPIAKIDTREDNRRCDDRFGKNPYGSNKVGFGGFGGHSKDCGPLVGQWPHAPTMTIFSSRGPNAVAPDIIKPDVTAPGIQILAGNSPFPDPHFYPGELFQAIAGTSMSSPHVAGIFALLKQAHPEWSPAAAKSALMTTSYQNVLDNDRKSDADPFAMGAGHVDPGGKWRSNGSINKPGLIYDAGYFDYLGFLCDAGPEVFADPAGTCSYLDSNGIPTKAYDLNYPSIGVAEVPGSQTVSRTVTSVADRRTIFRAQVKAPKGYQVSVEPKILVLNPGESATFEVTFVNKNAPIGEWRFGSLTWKGSGYNVYSPIAIKGALFSAPAELTGSGETGTTSFDVKFGYNGSYTAAAHGLVPATVTSSSVAQDPDQTFDPNDGYSDVVTFDLSDAAYFRIAMPPDSVSDPNVDIDLYLYDPTGVQVASSTNGGTDEQIDISTPMDGTWTLYVHGWQTLGVSQPYHLYSWAISATPGGNLSIDSAPTSATSGATGTIDVSWTGATTGQWHLGAVSHTGDSGLMGLTLINVDNR